VPEVNTLFLVAAHSIVLASGAVDCSAKGDGYKTQTELLDQIKRDFWKVFPPAEAARRTNEARIAGFEFARDWLNTCCLPRYAAAACQSKVVRLEQEIRNYDWRTPPR
jgi:hypothetical protein